MANLVVKSISYSIYIAFSFGVLQAHADSAVESQNVMMTTSQIRTQKLAELPKPLMPKGPLSPSKLTDYWMGINTNPAEGLPLTPLMTEQESNGFNFDLAARLQTMQVKPGLRAYSYLLNNGLNENKNLWKKILGHVGIIFGYQYDVEPTYKEPTFTRTDRYITYPGVEVRSTIKEFANFILQVDAVPEYAVDFSFIRRFSTSKEAIISPPYFVDHLPLTSERVLKSLNSGDIFTYHTHMDLLTKLPLVGNLNILKPGVSVGPYILLTGGFKLQITKLQKNRIKLSLISYRNKGVGVNATAGLIRTPEISSVKIIDRKIVKHTMGNGNLLTAEAQKDWNRAMVIEYLLDLSHPEVASAYDETLSNIRDFNYMYSGEARVKDQQFLEAATINLLPLDHLVDRRLVDVDFNARNDAQALQFRAKVGNKIVSLDTHSRSSQNNLTLVDRNRNEHRAKLLMNRSRANLNIFYSMFRTGVRDDIGAFVSASQTVSEIEEAKFPTGLVFLKETTDTRLNYQDVADLKNILQISMPELARQDLISKIEKGASQFENVYTKAQVVIPMKAINAIPSMSAVDIRTKLYGYLEQISLDDYLARLTRRLTGRSIDTPEEYIQKRVGSLSVKLETILKDKSSSEQVVQKLAKLFNEEFFKIIGVGFLKHIMPEEAKNLVHSVFVLSETKSSTNISIQNGPKDMGRFYSHLLSFEDVAHDPQLLIELESDKVEEAE